jgi:hypothetical protein
MNGGKEKIARNRVLRTSSAGLRAMLDRIAGNGMSVLGGEPGKSGREEGRACCPVAKGAGLAGTGTVARGARTAREFSTSALSKARNSLAGSTTATAGPDQERRGRERWGLGNRSRQGSHSKLAPNHDITCRRGLRAVSRSPRRLGGARRRPWLGCSGLMRLRSTVGPQVGSRGPHNLDSDEE